MASNGGLDVQMRFRGHTDTGRSVSDAQTLNNLKGTSARYTVNKTVHNFLTHTIKTTLIEKYLVPDIVKRIEGEVHTVFFNTFDVLNEYYARLVKQQLLPFLSTGTGGTTGLFGIYTGSLASSIVADINNTMKQVQFESSASAIRGKLSGQVNIAIASGAVRTERSSLLRGGAGSDKVTPLDTGVPVQSYGLSYLTLLNYNIAKSKLGQQVEEFTKAVAQGISRGRITGSAARVIYNLRNQITSIDQEMARKIEEAARNRLQQAEAKKEGKTKSDEEQQDLSVEEQMNVFGQLLDEKMRALEHARRRKKMVIHEKKKQEKDKLRQLRENKSNKTKFKIGRMYGDRDRNEEDITGQGQQVTVRLTPDKEKYPDWASMRETIIAGYMQARGLTRQEAIRVVGTLEQSLRDMAAISNISFEEVLSTVELPFISYTNISSPIFPKGTRGFMHVPEELITAILDNPDSPTDLKDFAKEALLRLQIAKAEMQTGQSPSKVWTQYLWEFNPLENRWYTLVANVDLKTEVLCAEIMKLYTKVQTGAVLSDQDTPVILTLKDLLPNHPMLIAYPELGEVKIQLYYSTDLNDGIAAVDPKWTADGKLIPSETILMINVGSSDFENLTMEKLIEMFQYGGTLLDSVMHESRHTLQEYIGEMRGGTDAKLYAYEEAVVKLRNITNYIKNEIFGVILVDRPELQNIFPLLRFAELSNSKELSGAIQAILADRVDLTALEYKMYQLWKTLADQADILKEVINKRDLTVTVSSVEGYLRLGGEISARIAGILASLTEDEVRLQYTLFDSLEVLYGVGKFDSLLATINIVQFNKDLRETYYGQVAGIPPSLWADMASGTGLILNELPTLQTSPFWGNAVVLYTDPNDPTKVMVKIMPNNMVLSISDNNYIGAVLPSDLDQHRFEVVIDLNAKSLILASNIQKDKLIQGTGVWDQELNSAMNEIYMGILAYMRKNYLLPSDLTDTIINQIKDSVIATINARLDAEIAQLQAQLPNNPSLQARIDELVDYKENWINDILKQYTFSLKPSIESEYFKIDKPTNLENFLNLDKLLADQPQIMQLLSQGSIRIKSLSKLGKFTGRQFYDLLCKARSAAEVNTLLQKFGIQGLIASVFNPKTGGFSDQYAIFSLSDAQLNNASVVPTQEGDELSNPQAVAPTWEEYLQTVKDANLEALDVVHLIEALVKGRVLNMEFTDATADPALLEQYSQLYAEFLNNNPELSVAIAKLLTLNITVKTQEELEDVVKLIAQAAQNKYPEFVNLVDALNTGIPTNAINLLTTLQAIENPSGPAYVFTVVLPNSNVPLTVVITAEPILKSMEIQQLLGELAERITQVFEGSTAYLPYVNTIMQLAEVLPGYFSRLAEIDFNAFTLATNSLSDTILHLLENISPSSLGTSVNDLSAFINQHFVNPIKDALGEYEGTSNNIGSPDAKSNVVLSNNPYPFSLNGIRNSSITPNWFNMEDARVDFEMALATNNLELAIMIRDYVLFNSGKIGLEFLLLKYENVELIRPFLINLSTADVNRIWDTSSVSSVDPSVKLASPEIINIQRMVRNIQLSGGNSLLPMYALVEKGKPFDPSLGLDNGTILTFNQSLATMLVSDQYELIEVVVDINNVLWDTRSNLLFRYFDSDKRLVGKYSPVYTQDTSYNVVAIDIEDSNLQDMMLRFISSANFTDLTEVSTLDEALGQYAKQIGILNLRASELGTSFMHIYGQIGLEQLLGDKDLKTRIIQAEIMEQSGKTPEEIALATGLFRDLVAGNAWVQAKASGKFSKRFEAKLLAGLASYDPTTAPQVPGNTDGLEVVYTTTLSKIWLEKPLYTAYSDLKDLPIYFVLWKPGLGYGGYCDPNNNCIVVVLPQNVLPQSTTSLTAGDLNWLQATIIHEIQHAIQDREGFTRGGSPDQGLYLSGPAANQIIKKELSFQEEEFRLYTERLLREFTNRPKICEAIRLFYSAVRDYVKGVTNDWKFTLELQKISNNLQAPTSKLWTQIFEPNLIQAISKLKALKMTLGLGSTVVYLDANQWYLILGGEVQARLAADLMHMTEAGLKGWIPYIVADQPVMLIRILRQDPVTGQSRVLTNYKDETSKFMVNQNGQVVAVDYIPGDGTDTTRAVTPTGNSFQSPVIPSKNARKSLVYGERGAQNIDPALLDQLAEAKKLYENGVSLRLIKQYFGWELDPTNPLGWKYEQPNGRFLTADQTQLTSSKYIGFPTEIAKALEAIEASKQPGGKPLVDVDMLVTTTLDQLLNDPILFKAYPQLAKLTVLFYNSSLSLASFNDQDALGLSHSRIRQDPDGKYRLEPTHISLKLQHNGSIRTVEGLFSTLIHEVQHAISNIEGFDRGASLLAYLNGDVPSDITSISIEGDFAKNYWQLLKKQIKNDYASLRDTIAQRVDKLLEGSSFALKENEWKVQLISLYVADSESTEYKLAQAQLTGEQYLEWVGYKQTVLNPLIGKRSFKQLELELQTKLSVINENDPIPLSLSDLYMYMYGEITSRNAEYRLNFDKDDVRRILFSDTLMPSVGLAIVLNEETGKYEPVNFSVLSYTDSQGNTIPYTGKWASKINEGHTNAGGDSNYSMLSNTDGSVSPVPINAEQQDLLKQDDSFNPKLITRNMRTTEQSQVLLRSIQNANSKTFISDMVRYYLYQMGRSFESGELKGQALKDWFILDNTLHLLQNGELVTGIKWGLVADDLVSYVEDYLLNGNATTSNVRTVLRHITSWMRSSILSITSSSKGYVTSNNTHEQLNLTDEVKKLLSGILDNGMSDAELAKALALHPNKLTQDKLATLSDNKVQQAREREPIKPYGLRAAQIAKEEQRALEVITNLVTENDLGCVRIETESTGDSKVSTSTTDITELDIRGIKVDPLTKRIGVYVRDSQGQRQMVKITLQEFLQEHDKYYKAKNWHKAPNGKKSKLTELQWVLVRTNAFKQWFGDWENDPANASKVLDENGEPLVVWHAGRHHLPDGHPTFYTQGVGKTAGLGAWFANEFFNAGSYAADDRGDRFNDVYISLINDYAVHQGDLQYSLDRLDQALDSTHITQAEYDRLKPMIQVAVGRINSIEDVDYLAYLLRCIISEKDYINLIFDSSNLSRIMKKSKFPTNEFVSSLPVKRQKELLKYFADLLMAQIKFDETNIEGVYLNMRNPYIVDAKGSNWRHLYDNNSALKELRHYIIKRDDRTYYDSVNFVPITFITRQDAEDYINNVMPPRDKQGYSRIYVDREITYSTNDVAKDVWAGRFGQGYDGVIIQNVTDGASDDSIRTPVTDYIIPKTGQAKNAYSNTTFNPTKEDQNQSLPMSDDATKKALEQKRLEHLEKVRNSNSQSATKYQETPIIKFYDPLENLQTLTVRDTTTGTLTQIRIPLKEILEQHEKYYATDKWHKAPNGQESSLKEDLWLLVRTPEFKKWFGDWENDPANASKILNDQGEPDLLLHGSPLAVDITEFKAGKIGWLGPAIYFTGDSSKDGGLMPVFVNARNPFYLDTGNSKIKQTIKENFADLLAKYDHDMDILYSPMTLILAHVYKLDIVEAVQLLLQRREAVYKQEAEYINSGALNGRTAEETRANIGRYVGRWILTQEDINLLKAEGYDSIVWMTSGIMNEVAVFEGTQVKGRYNRGTFDSVNPNYMESREGSSPTPLSRSQIDDLKHKVAPKDPNADYDALGIAQTRYYLVVENGVKKYVPADAKEAISISGSAFIASDVEYTRVKQTDGSYRWVTVEQAEEIAKQRLQDPIWVGSSQVSSASYRATKIALLDKFGKPIGPNNMKASDYKSIILRIQKDTTQYLNNVNINADYTEIRQALIAQYEAEIKQLEQEKGTASRIETIRARIAYFDKILDISYTKVGQAGNEIEKTQEITGQRLQDPIWPESSQISSSVAKSVYLKVSDVVFLNKSGEPIASTSMKHDAYGEILLQIRRDTVFYLREVNHKANFIELRKALTEQYEAEIKRLEQEDRAVSRTHLIATSRIKWIQARIDYLNNEIGSMRIIQGRSLATRTPQTITPQTITPQTNTPQNSGLGLTISDLFEEETDQKISSSYTSRNIVPTVFRRVKFKQGTVNLDYGGGKYDSATEFLASQGVTNYVYDPYNRTDAHNTKVIKAIEQNGGADTVTCSNVLNVIAEEESRDRVIRNIKLCLKKDGVAYFTVYSGNGSGKGEATRDGYQSNLPTEAYLDEIRKHFSSVIKYYGVIIATNGDLATRITMHNQEISPVSTTPVQQEVASATQEVATSPRSISSNRRLSLVIPTEPRSKEDTEMKIITDSKSTVKVDIATIDAKRGVATHATAPHDVGGIQKAYQKIGVTINQSRASYILHAIKSFTLGSDTQMRIALQKSRLGQKLDSDERVLLNSYQSLIEYLRIGPTYTNDNNKQGFICRGVKVWNPTHNVVNSYTLDVIKLKSGDLFESDMPSSWSTSESVANAFARGDTVRMPPVLSQTYGYGAVLYADVRDVRDAVSIAYASGAGGEGEVLTNDAHYIVVHTEYNPVQGVHQIYLRRLDRTDVVKWNSVVVRDHTNADSILRVEAWVEFSDGTTYSTDPIAIPSNSTPPHQATFNYTNPYTAPIAARAAGVDVPTEIITSRLDYDTETKSLLSGPTAQKYYLVEDNGVKTYVPYGSSHNSTPSAKIDMQTVYVAVRKTDGTTVVVNTQEAQQLITQKQAILVVSTQDSTPVPDSNMVVALGVAKSSKSVILGPKTVTYDDNGVSTIKYYLVEDNGVKKYVPQGTQIPLSSTAKVDNQTEYVKFKKANGTSVLVSAQEAQQLVAQQQAVLSISTVKGVPVSEAKTKKYMPHTSVDFSVKAKEISDAYLVTTNYNMTKNETADLISTIHEYVTSEYSDAHAAWHKYQTQGEASLNTTEKTLVEHTKKVIEYTQVGPYLSGDHVHIIVPTFDDLPASVSVKLKGKTIVVGDSIDIEAPTLCSFSMAAKEVQQKITDLKNGKGYIHLEIPYSTKGKKIPSLASIKGLIKTEYEDALLSEGHYVVESIRVLGNAVRVKLKVA